MINSIVLGVDRGTTFTKTDTGVIFKSIVNNADELKMGMKVEFKESNYIIGESGKFDTDLMKATNENTELLVYTAIAKSTEEELITVDLVVGLPIGQYSIQKHQMKDLFQDKRETIIVNDKLKYININRCEVFPEGAGVYYCQKEEHCLIVDIGGISVDNALFVEGKLRQYSTYQMGVMKLYSQIVNKINSKYDMNLSEWDVPRILKEGLSIYGKEIELNLDDIIYSYVDKIIKRLSLEYDGLKSTKVLLAGGGSMLVEDYFVENIPHSYRIGDQFSNAKGFKIIGDVIFNGKR